MQNGKLPVFTAFPFHSYVGIYSPPQSNNPPVSPSNRWLPFSRHAQAAFPIFHERKEPWMRFWEDMQSKYGFSDGGAVPDGAEVYRAVYIQAVNRLAEQLKSNVRAVAFDRTGVHNWCLVLFYAVKDLAGHTADDLTDTLDLAAEVLEPDEPMSEAIRQAYLLDLDGFIKVSVALADDFARFVSTLYPVGDGDPLQAVVNGQPQHIYPGGRVRLVQDVSAFGGRMLNVGSEYAVSWIDHFPPFAGLAEHPDDPAFAIAAPEELMVLEIPAEVRAASENCDPIPPFHLRDLADEPLDAYGTFYDLEIAQQAMERAAREIGKSVQLVNGYSNTVMSCNPADETE